MDEALSLLDTGAVIGVRRLPVPSVRSLPRLRSKRQALELKGRLQDRQGLASTQTLPPTGVEQFLEASWRHSPGEPDEGMGHRRRYRAIPTLRELVDISDIGRRRFPLRLHEVGLRSEHCDEICLPRGSCARVQRNVEVRRPEHFCDDLLETTAAASRIGRA